MEYKVKMMCYDPNREPYEDEPIKNPIYQDEWTCWEYALQLAISECNDLNNDLPKNSHKIFTIPDDKEYANGDNIKVIYTTRDRIYTKKPKKEEYITLYRTSRVK